MLSLAEAELPLPCCPMARGFRNKLPSCPKVPQRHQKDSFLRSPFVPKNQPTSLQTFNTDRTVSLCLILSVLPVQTSLCLFISVLSTNRDLALWPEIFPKFCISIVTYFKSQASFHSGFVTHIWGHQEEHSGKITKMKPKPSNALTQGKDSSRLGRTQTTAGQAEVKEVTFSSLRRIIWQPWRPAQQHYENAEGSVKAIKDRLLLN